MMIAQLEFYDINNPDDMVLYLCTPVIPRQGELVTAHKIGDSKLSTLKVENVEYFYFDENNTSTMNSGMVQITVHCKDVTQL